MKNLLTRRERPGRDGRLSQDQRLRGARQRRATPGGCPSNWAQVFASGADRGQGLPGTHCPFLPDGEPDKRDGTHGSALHPCGALPAVYEPPYRMLDQLKRQERGRSETPIGEVESIVLAYVKTERPEGVYLAALALHFNAEFGQGSTGLAVERAVRELVRDGRLRMRGGKVVPAHA